MKYAKLIDKLYNGNKVDVLQILNEAIYVTDFEPTSKDSFIVHTGFTFCTQHKEMVLFYEFETEQIIYQVFRGLTTIPRRVNGLIMVHPINDYLNESTRLFIVQISKNDNFKLGILERSDVNISKYFESENITELNCVDDGNEVIITNFKVIEENNNIKEYPLSKTLNHRFFFDGSMFQLD